MNEYRVTWQREAQTGKRRALYQTLAGAEACARRQATAHEEMCWLDGRDDYGNVYGEDRRPKPLIFGPLIEVREVGPWSQAEDAT